MRVVEAISARIDIFLVDEVQVTWAKGSFLKIVVTGVKGLSVAKMEIAVIDSAGLAIRDLSWEI